MAQHDRYDNDILKQLTRIANSLEDINKKIPNASNIIFAESFLGGLFIGYKNKEKEQEENKNENE